VRTLTRDEAAARAALVDVQRYDVHLDLRGALDGTEFSSDVEVRFSCRRPGGTTFVELDAEPVEVVLNGRTVPPGAGPRIALEHLEADNVLRVRARCSTSRSGEGLHRFVDPADGAVYLYAQAFLDDAQRMFACFDQPDLKAEFRLVVDAPHDWQVVGNTRSSRDGDRWTFTPTERIATYLFTVAAGPYAGWQRWRGTPGDGGVELGLWCRQSLAPHLDPDELFEVTEQAMDLQERLFDSPYPFGDTYDQLFVPEFNAGAMENPGAVTFREAFVFRSRTTQGRRRSRATVVAHELSHMWFGNLVTMRWWDDLWLNESFAELMGCLTVDRATRFEDTWVDFCAGRKAWGYRADALPTTHPVAGSAQDTRSALLDFDGISYAKGASVLRQLMATIGEDAFFAGVRDHLARHAWGNAGFADLLGALEGTSGRDLGTWARTWLQTAGTTTLRVSEDRSALLQEPPTAYPVLREHRTGVGVYDRSGDRLLRRTHVDVLVTGPSTALPDGAGADLVLPNDDDRTFARSALDPHSLATLTACIGGIDDPLARAVGWAALWSALREAELPAERFVEAVLGGVGTERDPGVVETLLGQARSAAVLYAPEPAPLLARLAAGCREAARSAQPGSDLQLAQVRAFAATAGPEDADLLQRLLDGDDVLEGLVVDVDLRWQLVQRLATVGRLDEAALEREAARDRTAAGRLAGLTASAARPVAAVKRDAFRRATTPGALSSHEAQALARGLWQPLQDDLCRPLVAGYVDVVPRLWEQQTPAAAAELTLALFPSTLPEPPVLSAVDGLLAGPLPAGASRVVLEQRHELERALRARQAAQGTPSASQTASAHWR
jgi:aminopeptidase N